MFGRRRGSDRGPGPGPAAPPALDVSGVPPRLRDEVHRAVDARQRWQAVVVRVAAGPLRDRLEELTARIDAGVADVHATATRIGEVEAVLSTLDPDGAVAAYKAARRRASAGDEPPEMDALAARFASVQRLLNQVADAEERLRVADARLLAAVARAAEVAVGADLTGLPGIDTDLDAVSAELDALRSALTILG